MKVKSESEVTQYTKAAGKMWTFALDGILGSENTVKVTQTSGATVRLDYCAMTFAEPFPLADLATATQPVPEYLYRITNQDHHFLEKCLHLVHLPLYFKNK